MSLEEELGYDPQEEVQLGAVTGTKKRSCNLCGAKLHRHMKRHNMCMHFPWYIDPASACWECKIYVRDFHTHISEGSEDFHDQPHFSDFHLPYWCQLMYGVLLFFINHLGLSSFFELLQYVLSNNLFPPQQIESETMFDHGQIRLLKELSSCLALGNTPDVLHVSPPNHIVCHLHWKILAQLLSRLNSDLREDFRTISFPVRLPNQVYLGHPTSYIDSHCHIDKVFQSSGFQNFRDFESYCQPCDVALQYCICNFVFPYLWPGLEYLPMIRGSIGVHPRFVKPHHEDEHVAQVNDYLAGGGFVGVGEVGLDYTTSCRCKPPCRDRHKCRNDKIEAQLNFLGKVIPLADHYHLPLILHCRGQEMGDGSAAEKVKELIEDSGFSRIPIHRHCYIENVKEMDKWLKTFPNLMFGFTNLSCSHPDTRFALSRLPMEKILLETDSPWLGCDNPWSISDVAKHVAKIKNLPLSLVVRTCNDNAMRFYRL